MKTVLTVIAFFIIAAVQAGAATAATEGPLSGQPMNMAKRLDLQPVSAAASADPRESDTPMSRAKLLAETDRVAPQAQGGDAHHQLGGVPMALAKRL